MHTAVLPWHVIWLTGLPCSGKTTLARALAATSPGRFTVLDGDELRAGCCADLGFSRDDRLEMARRTASLAAERRTPGRVAIVSTISPYRDCRAVAREILGPALLEVHVHASAETCAARDVKGHWAAARRGAIASFSGVNDPYEEPPAPDLRVATESESVPESVGRLLALLAARGGEGTAGHAGS
jgi:adenylyl-sulfate kinase